MPSVILTSPENWVSSIRSAAADDFWIWTLVLLVAGFACGYGIFHYIRRARILEDTPTSKIRSASQGYVEIIGTAQYLVNQSVEAPLTGTPCVWFSYEIAKKERSYSSSGSSSSWRVIDKEFSERPFQCVDDTGLCMINPKGAEVYPSQEDIWYGSEEWPVRGPAEGRSLFSGSRYRYTERRLYANDPLYAIGHFQTIDPNKARGDISEEVRAVLSVWKQDQAGLLERFDANLDGDIDMQEWEQVRQTAEQHVYEQRLQRADRPAINIMTSTGDFRRPYILSVKPQNEMVRKFRFKAAACTIGFILMGPVSVWLVFIRLTG